MPLVRSQLRSGTGGVHLFPLVLCLARNGTRPQEKLQIGDLVMIAVSGKIKGKYKLGLVVATTVSNDGLVRSGTVQYFVRRGVAE